MKKDNLSPREKAELDKMWPKAEDYIITCRPEGMSFEEYKVRRKHGSAMAKFRSKFYGFEPVVKNGKIEKEAPNSKRSSKGRKEDKQSEIPGQEQTGNKDGEGATIKE